MRRAPRTAATAGRMPRQRGFSLVETLMALSLGAVLLTVALPGLAGYWRQARRADAVSALSNVQRAQEAFRAQHGSYASSLAQLPGAATARSQQGFYELQLQSAAADAYAVLAIASASGPQSEDSGCTQISLSVREGFAQPGPEPRCWNR